MAACISEGLIKAWSEIHVGIRLFVGLVLAGLLATSYEHFSDFIRLSGGTSFSVHVGAAMVDAAILACVVTTCSLPDAKSKPRTRAVVEPKPKPAPKPEPKLAPKPAGGQRAENDRRDVETMRRLWPDLEFFTLSETERLAAVRKGMQCGGSRANRLIKLFESHLQSEIMGN
ncbi:MAG TPA: hypothetical protein VLT90_13000 [Terriglobales bacterium]|nr:hypothetical protein [Terriglobales bacterium]